MRVEEVMTAGAVTVKADATVGEAQEQMESLVLHSLAVTDLHGRLVGVLSTPDLVAREPTLPVSRVMSSPVRTLGGGASIHEAAQLMRENHVHHLVIIDGPRIVGMLSSLDLLSQL